MMGESHKSRGVANKLTNEQLWTLGKWLDDIDLSYEDSHKGLAEAAFERFGFKVTEFNIEGVLKMLAKKIPKASDPVPQDEAIKLLAQSINAIAIQLGIQLPAKFQDLL